MEMTKTLVSIFLTMILTQNFVLAKFLGICPFLGVSKKVNTAVGMSLAVIFVMALATAVTYPINKYLLVEVPYFQTMAFVIVVLVVVEIVHFLAKNLLDNYCRSDFIKFAIKGAVLGLCIHNTELELLEAVITAAAVGIGFMLAMTVFAKLKDIPVHEKAVPAPFRGLPIALLTAGMIVLAILALNF